MKKIISVLAAALLAVSSLAACSAGNEGVANKGSDKIDVVTTIFPEYDWVVNILGDKADNAEVTMLLDNGVDLHSFQPTAFDIAKIADCDLFIYVGGESDEWVDDALSEATNKDMVVINLLDVLGSTVKEEEVKEGMEGEEEEEEEAEEEGPEYDEHVWLSLNNAEVICDAIADALSQVDSANADSYKANAESYKAKLDELDAKYADTVASGKTKTLLFGDRFPFRYMIEDYGLDYYAAFVGCSAETEASFETVVFLANKVDELSLNHVMKIEGSSDALANTIISNTSNAGADILTLDSMQSTTSKDVANGVTYIGIMESNLEVLKQALN
jgi:zinc transport system substrate-binding protein